MKQCTVCKKKMKELKGETPEGVSYRYFQCACGEEIVDMKQLQDVAQVYRAMKKYHAKISKWGMSLGLRIPKDLAEKYHFSQDKEVTLIPDEEGIKIIPS